MGQGRAAEQIAGQGVFACAVFAFDGGHLEVGRGHFRLHQQLAPCRADADDLDEGLGLGINE